MTVREVAQYLRVHQTTVYRLLRTDSLPAFKVGSDWRFSQQAVEAWIKKNTDLSES
jgi:excisionase family DNA binding protein